MKRFLYMFIGGILFPVVVVIVIWSGIEVIAWVYKFMSTYIEIPGDAIPMIMSLLLILVVLGALIGNALYVERLNK